MAKAESVTIRSAKGGYIVEPMMPWKPGKVGEPVVPAGPRTVVKENLDDALDVVRQAFGENTSGNVMDDNPEGLFGD